MVDVLQTTLLASLSINCQVCSTSCIRKYSIFVEYITMLQESIQATDDQMSSPRTRDFIVICRG
jgi:hypothetical protein